MSLSASDIKKIGLQQGLTKQGLQFVLRAMHGEPSRAVANNTLTNVISDFPSQSMGATRQTESRSVERLGHLEREFAPSQYLWWGDQVEQVPIEGHRTDGKRYRSEYRADVLDIERTGIFVTEFKKEADLILLAKSRPKDWIGTADGIEFRPARIAFETLGIIHRVQSSADMSLSRGENIQLLLQAQRAPMPSRHKQLWKHVERHLKKKKVLRLSDLMAKMRLSDATPLLQFIAGRRLSTQMSLCRLSKPDSAWIARRVEDLWELEDVLHKLELGVDDTLKANDLPPPLEIYRVLERVSQLEGTASNKRCDRTLRRYKNAIRESGSVLGLVSKNKGRKGKRLAKKHEALINRVLEKYFAKPGRPSLSAAHKVYIKRHRSAARRNLLEYGRNPIVMETFRSRFLEQSATFEKKRGGRRADLAASAPTDPATRTLPASRAFQLAHMDHCLLKLFIVVKSSGGKAYTKRAWLSFLVDDCTQEILASALTFQTPSRRTCARVLRDCVRRHGRLPEGIMTDAGVEFRSHFYRELLASVVIERFQRPVAAGRWGCVVERAFGHFKMSIDGIPGQMIDGLAKSRSVSASHKAARIAKLEFFQANQHLEKFVQWFNNHSHGKKLSSPKIATKESLQLFSCSGMPAVLDQAFLIATSVPAAASEYDVSPNRGIHAQEDHYWCTALAGFAKRSIKHVRLDPENDSYIYVFLCGRWRIARSRTFMERVKVDPLRTMCETVRRQEANEANKEAKLDRNANMGHLLDKKYSPTNQDSPANQDNPAKRSPKKDLVRRLTRRRSIKGEMTNRRSLQPLQLIRR